MKQITEGRIRPSYIAAGGGRPEHACGSPHRGANSPLLHCGAALYYMNGTVFFTEGRIRPSYIAAPLYSLPLSSSMEHRGANSPLLHCGSTSGPALPAEAPTPRGEFAPPTLRHVQRRTRLHRKQPPRGEFAPPTLRLQAVDDELPGLGHRGANSPLLHCGVHCRIDIPSLPVSTEGRIRPSYIAASSGGDGAVDGVATPRGEFAPPTLRHNRPRRRQPHRRPPRGEFAPPTLRRMYALGIADREDAPRGEFAPPTLRHNQKVLASSR